MQLFQALPGPAKETLAWEWQAKPLGKGSYAYALFSECRGLQWEGIVGKEAWKAELK